MSTVWKLGDSRALASGVVPGSLRRGLPIKHDCLAGLSPTFHTVLISFPSSFVINGTGLPAGEPDVKAEEEQL